MSKFTNSIRDGGDGNGWSVLMSGVQVSNYLNAEVVEEEEGEALENGEDVGPGAVLLRIEQTFHGALSLENKEEFILTPEEAHQLGEELIAAAKKGENILLAARDEKEKRIADKKAARAAQARVAPQADGQP